MCLLALATVTADWLTGRGPVDGVFYRGAFHFGLVSPIPSASGTSARGPRSAPLICLGEELAVTVHGRAAPIDVPWRAERAGFSRALLEIYVPRYGPRTGRSSWTPAPAYARIDADRMFTFMPPDP